jgi:hypothetical protein
MRVRTRQVRAPVADSPNSTLPLALFTARALMFQELLECGARDPP